MTDPFSIWQRAARTARTVRAARHGASIARLEGSKLYQGDDLLEVR